MKKYLTLKNIIVGIILIIVLIFAIKVYKLKSIGSNVEVFNTSSNKNSKFIGILDNHYYKLEGGRFNAYDKNNNEIFSIYAIDIQDIIYDEYIYLIEKSGKIRMLDRNSGEEIKKFETKNVLLKAEFENDNINVYAENAILVLTDDLKLKEEYDNLDNPVSFDKKSNKMAIIEMTVDKGEIISSYKVKNGDNIEFALSSKNELFLKTLAYEDVSILFSNRYIYLIKDRSIIKKVLLENLSAIEVKGDRICVVDNENLLNFDKNLVELSRKKIGFNVDKLSIRNNSIIMLAKDKISVLENDNIIEEEAKDWISWFVKDNDFYLIFENRIQKINAY